MGCRMFDEIVVDRPAEKRIEEMDVAHLLPSELRELPPVIDRPIEPGRMLRKHGGACVFLDAENLCGIHRDFGYEKKPRICRDFPFRYVTTDRGVYTGLSFACTAVLANSGRPVVEQRAALEEDIAHAASQASVSGTPHLTGRHEISHEAYEQLEADFSGLLGLDAHPMGLRLVAMATYIDLYIKLLRETRQDTMARGAPTHPPKETGRFPPDSGPAPDLEVLGVLRRRYLAEEAGPLLALARRTRPSPSLQRAFLGLVTAFRQNLVLGHRPRGRVGTIARIVRHYGAHALRAGRVDLISLDGRFDYDAFRLVDFDGAVASEEGGELLARYFRHALFRKDLLLANSVWLGQRLMLMHYALIRWHAVGRAHLGGRTVVDLEDLREGIRAVEIHYLFHTPFIRVFQKVPALGMLLDGLVRRPVYAGAMTGPPV